MQGLLIRHATPERPAHPRAFFLSWGLLTLPWVLLWAPPPLPNTLPVLVSWACFLWLVASGTRLHSLTIAQAWTGAALISSGLGLIQYFGWASAWGAWVHVPPGVGEAMGNLRQRNQLATLTSMGVMAVLWWQTQGLRSRHAAWMLALLAVGNAATASRTGLVQMLLAVALCLVWSWPKAARATPPSWRWSLWALAVYVLANALLPHALSALTQQEAVSAMARMGGNDGCGSRLILWHNVLNLIGQHPWWGWGWGELKYAHYITPVDGPRFCDILGNAHNLPLHLAVELGIPAAVAILGSLGVWAVAMRPWVLRHSEQALAWGALAMIGLHSLLEFPLWHGPFQVATLLCFLMLWPAGQGWRSQTNAARRWLAAGGLVLIGLMALDYWRVRQVYLPLAQRAAFWRNHPDAAAQKSLFFHRTQAFAQLTTTPITAQNAAWALDTSLDLLHYSPEPRVVQAVIDSARLLGRDDLVALHQHRQQQAFAASTSTPP